MGFGMNQNPYHKKSFRKLRLFLWWEFPIYTPEQDADGIVSTIDRINACWGAGGSQCGSN